jgi:hypothetical protein
MLRAPLRLLTAVTPAPEGAILGRGEGVQAAWPPMPPAKGHPSRPLCAHDARARRSRGPGFPLWAERLHDDEPTQFETVTMSPEAGHPAQQKRAE